MGRKRVGEGERWGGLEIGREGERRFFTAWLSMMTRPLSSKPMCEIQCCFPVSAGRHHFLQVGLSLHVIYHLGCG